MVSAYKERVAAAGWMDEARQSVTEAIESLALNLTNIRRGAGLPGATRPIEVLQPIQALAQARADYLAAVLAYNRAQFRLYRALGRPPRLEGQSAPDHATHAAMTETRPHLDVTTEAVNPTFRARRDPSHRASARG